jgi:hypothetical protein
MRAASLACWDAYVIGIYLTPTDSSLIFLYNRITVSGSKEDPSTSIFKNNMTLSVCCKWLVGSEPQTDVNQDYVVNTQMWFRKKFRRSVCLSPEELLDEVRNLGGGLLKVAEIRIWSAYNLHFTCSTVEIWVTNFRHNVVLPYQGLIGFWSLDLKRLSIGYGECLVTLRCVYSTGVHISTVVSTTMKPKAEGRCNYVQGGGLFLVWLRCFAFP